MKFWNDGTRTVRCVTQPEGFIPGRLPFKRTSPTEETKRKISEGNKGKQTGPRGRRTDASRKLMSESAKERVKRCSMPDNTGRPGWNKGLTKHDDPRIAAYVEKQTGQTRHGNYDSHERWQGEGNPWFGKDRSGELHPSYNPDLRSREYRTYVAQVKKLTEVSYVMYMDEINPNNHTRTLCGVDSGYQLDHRYPIAQGYRNGVPAEVIAAKENLQMLPWKDNLLKSDKWDGTAKKEEK